MKNFYDIPIQNHVSVTKFENINGLHENIYFINHNKLESNVIEGQSKSNEFEAEFLTQFCLYLNRQSYKPFQITILAMYLGQLLSIRRRIKIIGLNGIQVSTVDNYQGEENDIILLSLVRSNREHKIGFLNIDNRVCVALSRAKKGFYCIGNLDMISEASIKWFEILNAAKQMKIYGDSLKLTCSLHSNNDVQASEPIHFASRPNGSCNQ